MRRVKSLIFVAVLAMMVLGLVATASAASVSNTNDAIAQLQALKVITGYEDGSFKPEQNITRAEFCAIAVRALGMEAAAKSAVGATKFSDVPASHWASGYVNLAVANGVIKGYPDGTFQPESNVTYAEAFAMLVRVLGYEPAVKGEWPTNYMGKASEIGILDNVVVTDYNAAATRGNVFIGTANAANTDVMKRTAYGDKEEYSVSTKTLMEDKLSVTKYAEATVTATPMLGADKDKIKTDTDLGNAGNVSKTLTLNSSFKNADDYWGLRVEAWEKDDEIFFLDVKTDSSDIISDKINDVTYAVDTFTPTTIKADKKDKWYTVAAGASMYNKYQALSASNFPGKDAGFKAVLDSTGKIKYAQFSGSNCDIVDEVKVADNKVNLKVFGGNITDFDTKNLNILRNGKTATLADVKSGDVVEFVTTSNAIWARFTDNKVTGKLEAVNSDSHNSKDYFVLTVDGKDYRTKNISTKTYAGVVKSTDNGDNYTTGVTNLSDFSSLINKNVTLFLTSGGSVYLVQTDSAATGNEFPVLIKEIKYDTTIEGAAYLRVAKFDGTNTYYKIDKDTKLNDIKIDDTATTGFKAATERLKQLGAAGEVYAGQIVKIALTSDGSKIDYIKTYDAADVLNQAVSAPYADAATGVVVNKDAGSLNIHGAGALVVNSDTKLIRVKSYVPATPANANAIDDVESTSWNTVKALSTADQGNAKMTAVKDGGVLKYIAIYNDGAGVFTALTLASDYSFGVVKSRGYNTDGDTMTILGSAGEQSKNVSSGAQNKATPVAFKVNTDGKFDNIVNLDSVSDYLQQTVSGATYNYFTVVSVDKTNGLLKLKASDADGNNPAGATNFYAQVDLTKTQYFDTDPSVPVATALDSITGYVVRVYDVCDTDGNANITVVAGGKVPDGVYDLVVVTKH